VRLIKVSLNQKSTNKRLEKQEQNKLIQEKVRLKLKKQNKRLEKQEQNKLQQMKQNKK
jgi:hypothetical protein